MGSIAVPYDIIEIGKASPIEVETIRQALRKNTLPTELLYDEQGLQLFEKITFNPEYYLTDCEIDILKRYAGDIARQIQHSTIIELGSGALRKTSLILQAVDAQGSNCDYYALDLDRKELDRSLTELSTGFDFKHVRLHGLHADYNDIHDFLKQCSERVAILWMGSSVGNFDRSAAGDFLLGIKKSLKPGDSMIIGADRRNDEDLVYRAYNDSAGHTEAFELNALQHANRILGHEAFKPDQWVYEGHVDSAGGYHESNFKALANIRIADIDIRAGTKIKIERSHKYSRDDMLTLLNRSQLNLVKEYGCRRDLYSLYITQVPPVYLSTGTNVLPSLAEWQQLWAVWDLITLKMIPESMLLQKPIDLRNPCIFYIGHIPTFLDIHLSRVDGGKYLKASYTQIFERGIDPDVDDPTQCHSHSEVPDAWPDLAEMLDFRDRVRQRLRDLYNSGKLSERRVARGVFTGFEHEAMHAETLLYMLLQSEATLPPPGVVPYSSKADRIEPAAWVSMPAQTISVGMDDVEGANDGEHFGWDNEKPRRELDVAAYEIASRPVTNGEYADYLQKLGKSWPMPKSWTVDGRVKTVFGAVPLEQAANWPVMASYDELKAYADYANARLPTYGELRNFIDTHSTTTAPGFNDVRGKAVNFASWTPQELASCAEPQVYTGVWEWTSTPFAATPGFVQSDIYPGYSADFFDNKHNIVLGGSWATLGRIAARQSFVNWYQRNYAYAWTGCRLARDVA